MLRAAHPLRVTYAGGDKNRPPALTVKFLAAAGSTAGSVYDVRLLR